MSPDAIPAGDQNRIMATIEELVRHLEGNPDDHAQRWRLAKKQYMACEYRDALNNLLTLKEEWPRKQNVLRYLAATYYRLGQYKQAIAELEDAIAEWPKEVALREQLARVYEVAGKREEASEVWQSILVIEEGHPIAAKAVDRLSHAPEESARDDLRLHDSDSGIDLRPVVVCTSCGAHNSEEFERCWQCHAPLMLEPPADPSSFAVKKAEAPSAGLRMIQSGAFIFVLSAAVFLTIRYVGPELFQPELTVSTSVYESLLRGLAIERGIMGLVLAIVWPAAVLLACKIFVGNGETRIAPFWYGVTLAGAVYCAAWLPLQIAPIVMAVIGVTGIAISPYALSLPAGRGIAAGLVHAVPALVAGSLAFVGLAGTTPWEELPQITEYKRNYDEVAAAAAAPVAGSTKFTMNVTFESSGSDYLDELAGAVAFDVTAPQTNPPLLIEFRDDSELLEIADITKPTTSLVTRIKPGQQYRLIVSGAEKQQVSVKTRSLLRPRVAS